MKPVLKQVACLLALASFSAGTEAWLEVPVEKMSLIQKVEAATITDHLAGIQRRELAKSAAMAVTPEDFVQLVELFKMGYKGKGVAVGGEPYPIDFGPGSFHILGLMRSCMARFDSAKIAYDRDAAIEAMIERLDRQPIPDDFLCEIERIMDSRLVSRVMAAKVEGEVGRRAQQRMMDRWKNYVGFNHLANTNPVVLNQTLQPIERPHEPTRLTYMRGLIGGCVLLVGAALMVWLRRKVCDRRERM